MGEKMTLTDNEIAHLLTSPDALRAVADYNDWNECMADSMGADASYNRQRREWFNAEAKRIEAEWDAERKAEQRVFLPAHLTQPAQAVDVDEPQVFQDLRYWMKHCVSACDEGEDFSLTRDDLIALTTLGLMEKAGRGKWRPTDKGRTLAALPNANGKEGCPHEWEQVTTSGGVMDRCSACGKHRWHDARGAQ